MSEKIREAAERAEVALVALLPSALPDERRALTRARLAIAAIQERESDDGK